MKKRWMALILTLALVFTLGASAVLADDEPAEAAAETVEAAEPAETDAEAAETAAEPDDAAANETVETDEEADNAEEPEEEPAPTPDAAGTLSFANLESRIRENSYTLLTLELQMEEIDAKSIEQMRGEVIDAMNGIADMQWAMINGASMRNAAAVMKGEEPPYSADELKLYSATGRVAAQSYQSTYDSLKQRLKDIDDGKTAKDMESMRRQVTAGENQLVMAMESAYIQLKGFEAQDAAITRGLAAYDRGLQVMRVSASNGLVSQLSIDETANQRAQLASTQKTLRMGVETGLMNLKAMVGEDLDKPLTLSALPKVTSAQLDAMDLTADLARAKEASADLYDAKLTYEQAREDYEPYGDKSSQRSWKAAQYTYEGAVQGFELSFRALYAQVKDFAQKVDAAKSALALEEKNYAVSALKYQQGTISKNALADAADALANAKDTVSGAERDLFSAYRSYYWAVEHGILN